jgi:tetratricopeptide (TPR) repeat protein
MADVAFGIWAAITQNSAMFGRLTWLAGALSLVLAAAIAAAGMIAWARGRRERRLPWPEAAEFTASPASSSGLEGFRSQLVGDIPQEPSGFEPRPGLLAELDGASSRVSVIQAVTGMLGVGTTQLAAAYARARLAAGWRLVAWVDARNPWILLAGVAAVAEAAGLSDGAGRDAADAGLLVRHRLETDGDGCLLVFDNASDPDVLRPFVPAVGAARVLITSNLQSVADLGASVPVDVFTAEEAVAFLAGLTGLPDADGAAAVAAELGYLPLALAQAAGVIAGQHLAYETYLNRLRVLSVQEYLVQKEGQPYPHGAAEAVLLSLDAVRADDQAVVCTGVMEVIAVLSAAGVRRDLLYAAGAAGVLANGGQGAEVSADLVDRALGQLAVRSLLTFSLDGQTIIVHPLVKRVVREGLARRGHLTGTCRAAASVLRARAEAVKGSPDRQLVRDVPEQVAALLETTATIADEADEELTRTLLRLRFWALYHLNELGDTAEQAVAVGEPLTVDLEQVLGPDHADTLASQDGLAVAYQAAGRTAEAIPLFEKVLGVQERVLGSGHPDTLAALDNLATAYRDAGRAAEAIRLHEQVVAAYERVLGPDDPDTLTSRDNLALACWAAGRVAEAIPLFEQIADVQERALGPRHPDTLTSRNNLATAIWAAGRAAEAIPLHEQVLAAREPVLGPEHPDTLTSRNNLAAAYVDAGRTAEAIPLLARTVAARERVLGSDHPRTRTSRNNLAIARSKRSKPSGSEQ